MTGQNESFKTFQDNLIEALPAMSSSSYSSSSSDEDEEERVGFFSWWNMFKTYNLAVAGTPDSPQEAAWLFGGWGHLSAEIRCPSKVFSLMSQSYTTDDPRPEFLVWRLAIWQEVPLCLRLCPRCTSTSAVFRCFWHNWAASIWGSGADVPFFGLSMLFESAKKSSILKHKKLSFTNRISTGDDCLAKKLRSKIWQMVLVLFELPKGCFRDPPEKAEVLGEKCETRNAPGLKGFTWLIVVAHTHTHTHIHPRQNCK